jgi:benzoate membrane transport protein
MRDLGLFGAVVTGAADGVPEGAGRGHCRAGPAGHHRQRLAVALKDESHREAALITFLVTLSGVTW